MRILILGGTGFIGSHIVESLVQEGHFLVVVDRTLKHVQSSKNIDYIQADISEQKIIAKALKGIDLVIHLISTTGPQSSNENPVFDTESNLINTINLLQMMRQEQVNKLIYFSSGGTVYGIPITTPIQENHQTKPLCSYGITKVAIENHIYMHQELYGLDAIILRPSNPYGPRQGHIGSQGVIATFANRILNQEVITIWGDGGAIRDYIYISDVIAANLSAIEQQTSGVFNVGSNEGYSVLEVLASIETTLGEKAIINYQPKRDFDIPAIVLDSSKAQEILDWTPNTNLDDGIRQYCNWLIQ